MEIMKTIKINYKNGKTQQNYQTLTKTKQKCKNKTSLKNKHYNNNISIILK